MATYPRVESPWHAAPTLPSPHTRCCPKGSLYSGFHCAATSAMTPGCPAHPFERIRLVRYGQNDMSSVLCSCLLSPCPNLLFLLSEQPIENMNKRHKRFLPDDRAGSLH